jgi:monovalent cation/proton antiporter MnhG/PhaG subunit
MKAITVDILLGLAVVAAWLAALGLVRLRSPYARLHMAGYAGVVSGLFVTLAVIASDPLSAASLKALIIYAALVFNGAVLTHAIGRAMRLRDVSRDRR